MNYQAIAEQTLKALGGKDNIISAAHCATRLRLALKDSKLVDEQALNDLEQVKGAFESAGQYQIIFGPGIVNKVHEQFVKLTGIEHASTSDVKAASEQNLSPFQKFFKMISDIFVPIIPALVAAGLLMGLNNLLTQPGLFNDTLALIEMFPDFAGLASLVNIFANSAFVFLPVLLGFTAAKRFGGNPILGAVVGMIMVHPDLLNAWNYGKPDQIANVIDVFGVQLELIGYQGTVLPILVSAWIMSKIEITLHKYVPNVIDLLVTPFLTVLLTGFIIFFVIGPVTRGVGDAVAMGLVWMYNTFGAIGGAVLGGSYSSIVLTGMHHSFHGFEAQLLADPSIQANFLLPIWSMANVAQGGAALGMFFVLKNTKMKSLALPSAFSAILGITEPALFGINLKLRYPFLAAAIGGAVGGAWITWTKTMMVGVGATGIPGIPLVQVGALGNYLIGLALAVGVAMILSIVFYKVQEKRGQNPEE
ncbi:MAG: sucrose-specific PTS transporter subunit IIBC [Culicoidibacterales bacterium]